MADKGKPKEISIDELFVSKNRVDIGKGGFGTVFTTMDHPNLAIKYSTDTAECYEWKGEFNVQSKIYETWKDAYGDTWAYDYIRVARPFQFIYKEPKCFIIMERICSPGGENLEKGRIAKAVHALMNHAEYTGESRGVGYLMGRQYFKDKIDVPKLVEAMGMFLAFVQYGLGYDGNDLEYIFGNTCGDDGLGRLYVIDFGLVKKYDEFNAKELARTLYNVEYFPLDPDKEYGGILPEKLKEGYFKVSRSFGKEEKARKVMKAAI